MSRIKAFPGTTGTASYSGEIDLRGEMQRMFHGSFQEIAKSHKVLLRRARRDSNDNLIACPCVDDITKEPDIDHLCPICGPYGRGYLWDEEWVSCRRVYVRPSSSSMIMREQLAEVGDFNVSAIVYYFEYTVAPRMSDDILEMGLDASGALVVPYVRDRMYKPDFITPFRGDNGRVEFYAAYCMQKDSISIGE